MAIERSLILLKPDCLDGHHTGEVIGRFEKAGFEIRATKLITLTDELLQEHYAHIADRPFFPEIVEFMSSRPVLALVLEGENAVAAIRELLGPTDSTQAPAGTIRGDMGTTSMKNICHASDSVENAAIEVDRFFEPSEVH
ncbi:MAG TPA: nucleoside-diphosphate kinase [Verrucomicrobiales bacterium]|nr:nucleoside-diphosphate kinase [Verrucomicrobiales bacterium]|tara:strand:+ start:1985 stop:2404 length:420 start_codon:yes stop_codon:yes gene_type:complete